MAFIKKIDGDWVVCSQYKRGRGKGKPGCLDTIRTGCLVKHNSRNVGFIHLPADWTLVLPKQFTGKKVRIILKVVNDDAILTTQYGRV